MATVVPDTAPPNRPPEKPVNAVVSSWWERQAARGAWLWQRCPGALHLATAWGWVLLLAVITDSFLNPRNEETAQQGDI